MSEPTADELSGPAVRDLGVGATSDRRSTSVRRRVPSRVLAESLATGKGLGFPVTQAASQLQYDTVWAMVVVTTVVSLALYTLAQAPERVVSASLGVTAP
jgi:hypothetical protein